MKPTFPKLPHSGRIWVAPGFNPGTKGRNPSHIKPRRRHNISENGCGNLFFAPLKTIIGSNTNMINI